MVEELYSIYTCIHSQFLKSNAIKIEICYRMGKQIYWWLKKKAIGKKDTFSMDQFQGTYLQTQGTVVRTHEVFTCVLILEQNF